MDPLVLKTRALTRGADAPTAERGVHLNIGQPARSVKAYRGEKRRARDRRVVLRGALRGVLLASPRPMRYSGRRVRGLFRFELPMPAPTSSSRLTPRAGDSPSQTAIPLLTEDASAPRAADAPATGSWLNLH